MLLKCLNTLPLHTCYKNVRFVEGRLSNRNGLAGMLFSAGCEEMDDSNDTTRMLLVTSKNIEKITSGLNPKAKPINLLRAITTRTLETIKYKEDSAYPSDFASTSPQANCVGYAAIISSCLDYLGRQDILDAISVGTTDSHTWLEFDVRRYVPKSRYESDRQSTRFVGLASLVNNALGVKLFNKGDYSKAARVLGRKPYYSNTFDLLKENYELATTCASGDLFSDLKASLKNPQCRNCEASSNCPCPCPIRVFAWITKDKLGPIGSFCMMCFHGHFSG